MAEERFDTRHIGPRGANIESMLETIGADSIQQLIEETVPANIRLNRDLSLPAALTELEFGKHIQELGKKNKQFKTYIGQGYYGTVTPAVIQRNVLENPGWYTAYTPYQAEISQGRLEALLNFQTMVADLTGMEIANASLLDEATAAAEAMIMFFNLRSRAQQKAGINKFFVAEDTFAQTKAVLETRAEPLNIEIVYGVADSFEFTEEFFGGFIQYPTASGELAFHSSIVERAHAVGARICVGSDLMALTVLKAPGQWDADCVIGSSQRFGVPIGYGGPHAAFFATREEYKRQIPGRIIGVSLDVDENTALRMALQTREQHIKRDKATSNICTAQALLAVMASFYAVYHGPEGLKEIAMNIHKKTCAIANAFEKLGLKTANKFYFDTISYQADDATINAVKSAMEHAGINLFYTKNGFSLTLDERTTDLDLQELANVMASVFDKEEVEVFRAVSDFNIPADLERNTPYLTADIFHIYRSETEMMRYIKRLENKDLSLVHSMISLGSCTMKLNAASELYPITNPDFANLHPFVPMNQAEGYLEMINNLDKYLSEITGFDRVSFQPNSGAQGEYTGLLVIQAYHRANGDDHRNICLIPSSAHGTNPASAVMAGMKVVVVKCDDEGNINIDDLREKAEKHKENLSALMVTYPSTHGVFEEGITEITKIIHDNGGQVYMDGANMNAQVGITNPGNIGADVCHLNLHKTFAIPHGGGGPGVGPIGVAKHLTPFLPSHPLVNIESENAIEAVSAAPFGSALILLISYGYVRMLGYKGLKSSTEHAILNANYIKNRLEGFYDVLYKGNNGRVAHEMILDCRDFKKTAGVEVADIAKRLIDYGFHAPTVSFPVAGTLMVEPTESESKYELDRFCDAMISIRKEIAAVEGGDYDHENNLLKNSPHTAELVTGDEWPFPYSRKEAAYPIGYLKDFKYWAPVRRVDNAYGDRNLVCSCTPIEAYA